MDRQEIEWPKEKFGVQQLNPELGLYLTDYEKGWNACLEACKHSALPVLPSVEEIQVIMAKNLSARNDGTMTKTAQAILTLLQDKRGVNGDAGKE